VVGFGTTVPALRELLAVFALLVIPACLGTATKTTRPEVDLGPWEERELKSPGADHTHRFLFLAGPSPDAPPMLLLPGGFVDHRIWLNVTDLSARFNLYALDYPDHRHPFYDGNYAGTAALAMDFIVGMGIEDLHVVGISAGGQVAVELLARHRERLRVRSLHLVSTTIVSVTGQEVRRRVRLADRALKMKPGRFLALVEWLGARAKFDPPPGAVKQGDFFWVRPYEYYRDLFSLLRNEAGTKPAVEHVTCPVFVQHGTRDSTISVQLGRLTPAELTQAAIVEMKEYPGYRHAMTFSHGPEIAASMLDFIDRNPFEPGAPSGASPP
jgi:pimeloyl-ACP methyl ester carboxylesterase